jgi:lipopolysaccharide/colanic/teichoic acid biosynthesis glycosyltransferase
VETTLAIVVIISVATSILANELCGWVSFVAHRLIRRLAKELPAELSSRMEEEWLGEVQDRPSTGKLWFALGLLNAVRRIRHEHGLPPLSIESTTRARDLVVAGMGLVFSAPMWVLFAVAIKLEDGGPVFYGQQRVGRKGDRFWSWKFRSMVPDSDRRFGPMQARDDDPRITRIGRILRATAIDELPQLWNIFKGDMSLVGPRALLPMEIEVDGNREPTPIEAIPGYQERHQVRPGLTGLAQVCSPRGVPRRDKFMFDLVYVHNRSFWLDLKLITLSFWITFWGKWESHEYKL